MRGTEGPGLGAVIDAAAVLREAAVRAPSPGRAADAACRAVRLYQRVFAGRLSPCRFWPTCSNYALDALTNHGFWRGSWLTARRLARCHPWGGHGVDPVPERGAH